MIWIVARPLEQFKEWYSQHDDVTLVVLDSTWTQSSALGNPNIQ